MPAAGAGVAREEMADPAPTVPHGTAARLALARHPYVERGPHGAPALVLLHGTRRTRSMWNHQLDGLSDAFRVIAVDLPGHGTLADVPFRLSDATAMVREVIDIAAGGRAIVVGQSLGGYVGMDLASRHSAEVAGLVLACASAEPRWIVRRAPRTVGSYLLVAAGDRLRARGGAGGGSNGHGPDDGSRTDAASPGAADADLEAPATNGWLFKGGTRALVSALREAFLPRLQAFRGPVLFVNGEHDQLFRHGERDFLAAATNGRLEVIPNCGHLVNEDQPVAFNAAVRRFAAEVGAHR